MSDKPDNIEIPVVVLKTRSLLALRGFTASELLEYDDRFVMHPTRDTDDGSLKYTVWVLKDEKVVGVALVRDLVKEMEENESQRGMLVGGIRFTPAASKYSKVSRVELVEGHYASFDLFGHEMVPPHVIAEESEVQMVLDHYGINKTQLPRILVRDPAARVLGARPGQIVRIERDSLVAGRSYYYRLVVDS
ncbi:MAG: DNA-directed RNA polymerase subunit H [Candidatus Thorarchaeota archaeon]